MSKLGVLVCSHCNINCSHLALWAWNKVILAGACPYTPVTTQRCSQGSMCSQCGWKFAGVGLAILVGNRYLLPLERDTGWATKKALRMLQLRNTSGIVSHCPSQWDNSWAPAFQKCCWRRCCNRPHRKYQGEKTAATTAVFDEWKKGESTFSLSPNTLIATGKPVRSVSWV